MVPTKSTSKLKPIPRLLLTAALITTLTLISILTFFVSSFASNLKLRTGLVMTDYLKLNDTLGCENHPERFEIPLESGGAIFAYDLDTFISANPNAPKMPQTLIDDINKGARFPLKYNLFSGDFGYFTVPLNAKGPCGLLLMKFKDYRNLRIEAWLLIFGMILLSCFAIAMIGFFWLLRPSMRRVATLTHITSLMGNDDGFPEEVTSIDDEYSIIERGLHGAHIRLLKDKRQLEQTAQALRHHLNDVAHDLRTPIASLQLALEQLKKEKELDSDSNHWLTTAIMDTVFLESLTDNLRIETQLREGFFELKGDEKTDWVEVVQRVAARFNLLANQRGIKLAHAHPDGEVIVHANPVLAERALGNIVHNAIRYGNRGGNVAIVLDVVENTFHLSILDDGPGISEENLQKVKERNYRGSKARERESTGQGLGLGIAQAFTDQSAFALDFKLNDSQGLKVTIRGQLF